jgi:hypothetical protein
LPSLLERAPGAAHALASGLALSLYDTGWSLTAAPGEPVRLTRAGHAVEPFVLTHGLAGGAIDAGEWRRSVDEAGIAALPLGTGTAGEPRAAALAR